MFRILDSRPDVTCLIVLLSLNTGLTAGNVYAQPTYTIPNSRYVSPEETGSVKAAIETTALQTTAVQKTVAEQPVTQNTAVIAGASLVALTASGQFLSPAAPALTVKDTEQPSTLDLGSAVRQAVAWYPDIKRASEGVDEQLQRVEVARAGYFPRVNGGIRSGFQSGAPGGSSAQVFDLSASQMLYDFGKVSSVVQANQAGVVEREADVRLSIEQVAINTALAFLDSQFYQRMIVIARDQIDSLEKVSGLARQRFDMGASTRSDYVQTVSRIEAAKATEFQHQANLARALSTLSNLTGQPEVLSVSDRFPRELEQSCQHVDVHLQDNPEVQSAQARVVRAQAEVESARAAGLPTLSLDPTFTQQLDGTTAIDQDRSRYSVFLTANMPIYQGGAIQAGKAASQRALASSEAALDTVRLRARQEMQQSKSQVLSLHSSLGAQALREKTIDETRVLYRQQYLELGTRPLLDLLNAEQETFLSRVEQQSTLNNLRRLQINCLYSAGHLSRSFDAASDRPHNERLP